VAPASLVAASASPKVADHAQHLGHLGDDQAAAAVIGEAVGIAERLGYQPLLGRAADLRRRTAGRGHGGFGTRAGESAAVGDG
jgi:hypothetical protein